MSDVTRQVEERAASTVKAADAKVTADVAATRGWLRCRVWELLGIVVVLVLLAAWLVLR